MAWLHSNGAFMDVNAEVKEALFPGAACLLRTVFDDYEEFENNADFSIELLNDVSKSQRAIFAGETFLLLFDPSFAIPQRAMHEAFASEFLLHTLSHIVNDIHEEKTELRKRMFKVLGVISPKNTSQLGSWQNEDLDVWQECFASVAYQLVGEPHYEYLDVLNKLDRVGAGEIARVFLDLHEMPDDYFEGYDEDYFQQNMNQIVTRCAKIIDFIEKYQENGNFRPHP